MLTARYFFVIAIAAISYIGVLRVPAQERQSKPGPTSKPARWIASEYRGLRLGKSTIDDVLAKFGKPDWEGENEEKWFESDAKEELALRYYADGDRLGDGERHDSLPLQRRGSWETSAPR